jgi:hypothetical protein
VLVRALIFLLFVPSNCNNTLSNILFSFMKCECVDDIFQWALQWFLLKYPNVLVLHHKKFKFICRVYIEHTMVLFQWIWENVSTCAEWFE